MLDPADSATLKAAIAVAFTALALVLPLWALKRRGAIPAVKHFSRREKWLLAAFIVIAFVVFPIVQYYAAFR
jgi:hypothetical protein